ncbi:hypothetical protein J18TS1_28020 [Oceanobacillus oncorhynchi subsp. incaldanensis]|uniref:hypothetical protein n=1 Tax=Oceanobacillus oncorhynchi TaxID=545501 RepID=UPI001B009F35|nr:hypothetical protein [Oceanobacillus oncorhynchi]GIO19702.1 hypothetical protein J18TS1_28020 [Oceanobacillus oncorhynchi subsp. incaldanensis]
MIEEQILSLSRTLKDLSMFTKNIIIYKSSIRKKDRVHISSIRTILERRIQSEKNIERFFNHQDKSIVKQLLDYLSSCGEVMHLGEGYYAVLPERYVRLRVSKSLLKVGDLQDDFIERLCNLGLSKEVNNQKMLYVIPISDYRFDFDLEEWIKVFEKSDKVISLCFEQYYLPTMQGRFKRVESSGQLKKEGLYYIISRPFENKKEHFIAKRDNDVWIGEMINDNLLKSKMTLLITAGYRPSYKLKLIGEAIIEITLSNILPTVEREQIYLFSLPYQLNGNRVYYVRKQHLSDFIYILEKLKFKERDERS